MPLLHDYEVRDAPIGIVLGPKDDPIQLAQLMRGWTNVFAAADGAAAATNANKKLLSEAWTREAFSAHSPQGTTPQASRR